MGMPPELQNLISWCSSLQTPSVITADESILDNDSLNQVFFERWFFVTRIDSFPITNKGELLESINKSCNFPGYFMMV